MGLMLSMGLVLLGILAVLALCMCVVWLAVGLYRGHMRKKFYEEYRIRLQPFVSVHERRRREGPGTFTLDFPEWTFPNGDGSRDKRRNNNWIQWGSCRLNVGRFSVTCASPLHMLWLVEALRDKGLPIDRCREEQEHFNQAARKAAEWEQAARAKSIYEWCRSQGVGDKKSAGDAFEELCAQLFRRMGCEVHVTPSSNDEGRDIDLTFPDGKTAIVECKCYADGNLVGRETLQKLVGVNRKFKADRIIIITTSGFVGNVKQWIREIEDDVKLIDGKALARLMEEMQLFPQGQYGNSLEGWKLSIDDITGYYPPDYPPHRASPPTPIWASRNTFWISFGTFIASVGIGFALVTAAFDFRPDLSSIPFLNEVLSLDSEVAAPVSEYILPDSNSRYYSREELEALSDWELYVGHNEIFARHGRGFQRGDLAEHFSQCSWYAQVYTPEEFDAMPPAQ